jgi:hypothetical protein
MRPIKVCAPSGSMYSGCLANAPSPRFVRTGPGETLLTRILRGASSLAQWRVAVASAAFVAP